MRIEQVVSGISRRDAGPSYSVTRLSEELSDQHEVRLHTLDPRPTSVPDVETIFYPRLPLVRSLGVSRAMKRGLAVAAPESDIMHFHGLWMMPNVYPARAVRHTDCSLVMSPRGMLDEWALRWSRRRKAVFWRTVQKASLDRVDCFHATSDREADAIRSAGFSAPIAIIPIGIDIPVQAPENTERDRRMLLYLGRLHPKKNVESLLTAWARVQSENRDWELQIVGDGTAAYVSGLKHLASSLNVERVRFRGPIFGSEKEAMYKKADLFVLPTHTENFGITVAEALSNGVPVITTKGAPWQELEFHRCGWWIDSGSEALTDALSTAMGSDPKALQEMGVRGLSWMERDFAWPAIAFRTMDTYRWILDGGQQPSWVNA